MHFNQFVILYKSTKTITSGDQLTRVLIYSDQISMLQHGAAGMSNHIFSCLTLFPLADKILVVHGTGLSLTTKIQNA